MRIIFILFFLFTANKVFALDYFVQKCDGFCEGELLSLRVYEDTKKVIQIIKGKEKKVKTFTSYRGIIYPMSTCTPFLSWKERAYASFDYDKGKSKKTKKPDFIIDAYYEMNTCVPCPPEYPKIKNNKSGYCPIPMFSLQLQFLQAMMLGYEDIQGRGIDLNYQKQGRSYSDFKKDNQFTRSDVAGIVTEHISLSSSFTENVRIARWINRETKKFDYMYAIDTYKTYAKDQVIRSTEPQFIEDDALKNWIDDFILNTQSGFAGVFAKDLSKDPNLEALLDKKGVPFGDNYLGYFPMLHKMIPTKESMSVFKKDLKKVAEFQIMRRD